MSFIFGTNVKMNHTPEESGRFVAAVSASLQGREPRGVELFYLPPFTSLAAVAPACARVGILVGAQNMHWADDGQHTGEISATMLRACGADLVMLGHAERRQQFGETDDGVHRKIGAALRHGLRILLCVGETAAEKKANLGDDVLTRQVGVALTGVDPAGLAKVMILYEPVWSIGTGGEPAAPDYVAARMDTVRSVLRRSFADPADTMPVLYGGSVDAGNCGAYAGLVQCDGLGVGRAAWQAEGFMAVLTNALEAREQHGRTEKKSGDRLRRSGV